AMPEPSIEIIGDIANQLGEGPCWHGPEQALYWVDALAPAVHRLDAAGKHDHWVMPEIIGSFVFRRGGGLVGALKTG
ncbi:SMP-30/gluconolactonase/LRE family protein, partial [Serratia marcescens]|uniref:SMP-30/gluconolactonase/LRE family protein n=1 Tax=Serratia marcescens TaxID=615 RepID=UPI001953015A